MTTRRRSAQRDRETDHLAAEIEGFARHLERFPYFGLARPVGKRIAAAVARAPRRHSPRRSGTAPACRRGPTVSTPWRSARRP
ncbi:MAG: hypothetical protein IRZ13_17260 [Acetobacteraceae bacterium]|nr:hypothetical protein [Acetobacteraceae bacterium]